MHQRQSVDRSVPTNHPKKGCTGTVNLYDSPEQPSRGGKHPEIPERVLDFDPEFLDEEAEHMHDETVTSVSCKIKGNVNQMLLQSWVQRLITEDGANLYRYKGIIAVKGVDTKFIFQGVGRLFNGIFSDQKWSKPESERESIFVFIGKNLDHDWLRDCFKACIVSDKLRFNVGDKVQCNI
jgi:G3E family GTPase